MPTRRSEEESSWNLPSPIVISHRMKHIECLHGLISCDALVNDAAGYSPHLAGTDRAGLVTNRERELTFEQHPHLLVRMAMRLDDSMRLKLDERKHHLLAGTGLNLHAGKNLVAGTFARSHKGRSHACA